MPGKYWQRQMTSSAGTGQMPFATGTSTFPIFETPPTETGSSSLLRLIVTGKLSIEPVEGSAILPVTWPATANARLVAALQEESARWPTYGDINNVNILGRTTLIGTHVPANSVSQNGAAVYQTVQDIEFRGMRDFSNYPTTPVLRIGGNWASLEGIGDGLYDCNYAWWATVSILWGVEG